MKKNLMSLQFSLISSGIINLLEFINLTHVVLHAWYHYRVELRLPGAPNCAFPDLSILDVF